MTFPSPYLDVPGLLAAPLPVSWSRLGGIGGTTTPNQNTAEMLLICETATSLVDGEVGQMLRATVNTETLQGYGPRVGYEGPFARFMTSMTPVLKVVMAQYAIGPPVASVSGGPVSFQWQPVPAGAAFPAQQPFGIYGSSAPGGATAGQNAVYITACYVPRGMGRQNTRIALTYVNGWPHTALTADALAGDTTISVDDVTGWYNSAELLGARGRIYAQDLTEAIQVVGVTPATAPTVANPEPAGPGTLTLATGLLHPHTAAPLTTGGPLVSAMPTAIRDATGLFAAAQGLRNGLAAATVPSLPGVAGGSSSGGVEGTIEWLERAAAIQLNTYRRIIGA